MARDGDDRLKSLSLFAAQVDFTVEDSYAGSQSISADAGLQVTATDSASIDAVVTM